MQAISESKNNKRLNKAEQELFNEVVAQLEKGTAPWQIPWDCKGAPQNMKTEAEYSGQNKLYLSIVMLLRKYKDPRFITFIQMREYNKKRDEEHRVRIPKGTKGYPIQYVNYYSRELKRTLTGKDFKNYTQAEIQDKLESGEIYFFSKIATVFNIEQCEGVFLKYFDSADKRKSHVDLDLISELANKMNLKLNISPMNNQAFYSPTQDMVHLPSPERFKKEEGFYKTTFHEYAHATGHSSRLNRELSSRGDPKSYAKEELRAEIASLFLAQKLDFPAEDVEVANSSAYIESWLSLIKKEPNILFESAKDASDISDYLYFYIKEYEDDITKVRPKYKEIEEVAFSYGS